MMGRCESCGRFARLGPVGAPDPAGAPGDLAALFEVCRDCEPPAPAAVFDRSRALVDLFALGLLLGVILASVGWWL